MKLHRLGVAFVILAAGVAGASAAAAADMECFHRCGPTAQDVRFVPVAEGVTADEGRWNETTCWPPGCGPCIPRNSCEVRLGVGAWFPSVESTLRLDGTDTTTDFEFTDWFENLDQWDWGMHGFLTYRQKCWTFGASYLHLRLGDTVPLSSPQGTEIDSDVSMSTFKLWVGYDLFRRSLSRSTCWPCLTAQAYVGMRIHAVRIEATIPDPGPPRPPGVIQAVDQTQEWVDPLVGTNLRLDLSPSWAVILDADIGGFNAGSDYCWHVALGVEWRLARWLALQAGWDVLEIDYDEGGFTDEFGFKATLSGPYLNLVFVF